MNLREAVSKTPVFILAGGLGTRLSEETQLKPKPMVEVGDVPVLMHLMRWYYQFGFNDFVICGGYRCWEIKKFFLEYEYRQNNIEIDHRNHFDSKPTIVGDVRANERWRVRVIDTGDNAMTGARLARAFDTVSRSQEITEFALTYGDGLSDVDLLKEYEYHSTHKKIGTVLGVIPDARFGELKVDAAGNVEEFVEKPRFKQARINGGFFFFNRSIREYLSTDDDCILEKTPLEKLVADRQLCQWKHDGFWQPMDTLRDKVLLESLWKSGKAPWKVSAKTPQSPRRLASNRPIDLESAP